MPPQHDRRARPARPGLPARKRWGQHFLASPETARAHRRRRARRGGRHASSRSGPGDGALTRAARRARAGASSPSRSIRCGPRRSPRSSPATPRVRIFDGDVLVAAVSRTGCAQAGCDGPGAARREPSVQRGDAASSSRRSRRPSTIRPRRRDRPARGRAAVRRPAGPGRATGTSRSARRRYATGRILFDLPPGAFRPRPKVSSSVLELTPRAERSDAEPRRAARSASRRSASTPAARRSPTRSRPRARARSGSAALEALGKTPRARAEELSLEEFLAARARVAAPRDGRARSRPARRRGRVRQERPLAALRRARASSWTSASRSPTRRFPGIDRIAPDLSVLSRERIDGVFLTHGHEDHIGALSVPARMVRRAGLRVPVHARDGAAAARGGRRSRSIGLVEARGPRADPRPVPSA